MGTPAAAATSFIHAFEPSRRAAGSVGAEREPAACTDRLRDTGHERALGADDDDVDFEVVGERRDRGRVFGVHGHAPGDRGDTGVPGRGDDIRSARRSQQPPDERVLAPACPDDEELHAAFGSTTVWARSGPTATNDTGTPASDSTNFT